MHDRRVVDRDRDQLAVEERRHLAGEADHRQQVDAVQRRGDVEDLLVHGQDVRERRPRLDAVGQDHDPGVVGAEADLVLREDHPSRHLAPQRPLVERGWEPGQQNTR